MKKKIKQPTVKVAKQNSVDLAVLPAKERDSCLPAVGTVITKTFYKSISRMAMDIVKRPISGYVFLGLIK